MENRVFLACPTYGQIERETAISIFSGSQTAQILIRANGASLLALNCNLLWCEALNGRETEKWTHFAMHHSDIAAENFWLDKLVVEQKRVGADVLSVVVPIKDEKGLSSTGLLDAQGCVTRFSMSEIHKLPETFSAESLGEKRTLVVNTGLFICDFTNPWVEKVFFEIRDNIVKNENGKFEARNLSEDWGFSNQCAKLGVKVFATRCVKLRHFGRAEYRNDEVWGNPTDPGGL